MWHGQNYVGDDSQLPTLINKKGGDMRNGLLTLNIVRAFTLLALSIMLSGCGEKEIAGQIFVVTQAKENIKLALVAVGAISQEEFDQFLKTKQGEMLKQRVLLNPKYLEAKSDIEELKKDIPSNEILAKYLTRKEKEGVKIAGINIDAMMDEVKANAKSVIAEYEAFDKAEFLLDGLPKPKFISKTDADGKFTLTLPKGNYVITANSSRSVFNSSETYHWLVSVDTSSVNQLLMLSNDNLLGTKCNECVKFQ